MSKKTQAKITRKTNPRIPQLIDSLKDMARSNDASIWRDMAKRLEKPGRNYAQVNLSKISRYSDENETVIIPGKVLGAGSLGHAVTIVALGFSTTAQEKIANAGGKFMTIEQMMDENPKGSNIKILK
jgi:large subunit ribosomal protein L18e